MVASCIRLSEIVVIKMFFQSLWSRWLLYFRNASQVFFCFYTIMMISKMSGRYTSTVGNTEGNQITFSFTYTSCLYPGSRCRGNPLVSSKIFWSLYHLRLATLSISNNGYISTLYGIYSNSGWYAAMLIP